MNRKKFDYFEKDIKPLKKDIFFRCVFAVLILATMVWQSYSFITGYKNGGLSTLKIIVAGIVIITGAIFFLTLLSFVFKDYRIIGSIKTNGKCTSSVNILFNTDKTSFIKLYEFLMFFLSLSTGLVLVAGVTYSILEVAYFKTISFFMPMLILICLASFSSLYTIKDEIRTQRIVQLQSPKY